MGAAGKPESNEATSAPALSRDEDDELRRLYWLAQNGELSPLFRDRLLERRHRDRRNEIRQPREFESGPPPPADQ